MMKRAVWITMLMIAGGGLLIWMGWMQVRVTRLNQALCLAASYGQTARVASLLRQGADPNAVAFVPNPDGDCYAESRYCHPGPALLSASSDDTLAVLLRAGADPNTRSESGGTVLMGADSPRLVKLLLAHGAQVNARNHDGETALMHAAEDRVIEAQTSQGEGIDIHARDHTGKTLLSRAVDGSVDQTLELLAAGADVNARDHHGLTALGHALALPDTRRIVAVLTAHGARR